MIIDGVPNSSEHIMFIEDCYRIKTKQSDYTGPWETDGSINPQFNKIINFFRLNNWFKIGFPIGDSAYVIPDLKYINEKFEEKEEKLFTSRDVRKLKKGVDNGIVDFMYESLNKRLELSDNEEDTKKLKSYLETFLRMALKINFVKLKYDHLNYISFSKKCSLLFSCFSTDS